MVFSAKDRKVKKLELSKVPVLLVITGKPQTFARDIRDWPGGGFLSRAHLVFSAILILCKDSKIMFTRAGSGPALK